MTDVVNPKSTSPDQLLPYHKKISAEGKALMKCFISYTYMVLKRIQKMPGFIGFGARYSDAVPIKTAPAWCPEKKGTEVK